MTPERSLNVIKIIVSNISVHESNSLRLFLSVHWSERWKCEHWSVLSMHDNPFVSDAPILSSIANTLFSLFAHMPQPYHRPILAVVVVQCTVVVGSVGRSSHHGLDLLLLAASPSHTSHPHAHIHHFTAPNRDTYTLCTVGAVIFGRSNFWKK